MLTKARCIPNAAQQADASILEPPYGAAARDPRLWGCEIDLGGLGVDLLLSALQVPFPGDTLASALMGLYD